jgi:hypothetical protein
MAIPASNAQEASKRKGRQLGSKNKKTLQREAAIASAPLLCTLAKIGRRENLSNHHPIYLSLSFHLSKCNLLPPRKNLFSTTQTRLTGVNIGVTSLHLLLLLYYLAPLSSRRLHRTDLTALNLWQYADPPNHPTLTY